MTASLCIGLTAGMSNETPKLINQEKSGKRAGRMYRRSLEGIKRPELQQRNTRSHELSLVRLAKRGPRGDGISLRE